MAPSAFYRDTWGQAEAFPPEKLRPDAEISKLLTAPRPEGSNLPPSPFEMEVKNVGGKTLRHWKHFPATYRDVWTNACKAFADREYITYEGETMTYKQAYDQSRLTAHLLSAEFQVRRGDRVAIACRNNLEFVTTWWACHLIGAVATLLNAFADQTTLNFCIQDSGCRVLLCDVERWERIRPTIEKGQLDLLKTQANDENDSLRGIVVIPFGKGQGKGRLPKQERTYLPTHGADGNGKAHSSNVLRPSVQCFEALSEKWRPTLPSQPPATILSPEDFATIIYTSGTTGTPKGVLSTNRQSLHCLGATMYLPARCYLRRHRPLPDPTKNPDVPATLMCFPLFHVAGILSSLVAGTSQGIKVVLMYAWDVDEAVKLINEHKIVRLAAVAYMTRQLAVHPAEMPSLGAMSHGGSASAKELSQEMYKKTGKGLIGNGYGATETNALAAGCYQDDYMNWPDSCGMPPPTTDIKIMNPDSLIEMPQGKSGEIWVRGPGIATGYWNRPKATAEVFLPDGFYRTGDVGYVNTHGALFIQDRVKDLIIRGGENISCTVVENALYSQTDVMECAAVGLPDSNWGERVSVFVVPRQGVDASKLNVDDLKRSATKQLSKHQVPEFIHVQAEPLPKNSGGKVDKKILRDQLKQIAREKKWGDFADAKSKL
ncbi:unnamed protein product [Sympodiomycopsis kandeliae]